MPLGHATFSFCLALVLAAPVAAQVVIRDEPIEPEPPIVEEVPPEEPSPDHWAPDSVEPGSVEKIREATTAPEFLPESVAYVPDSETVPSPAEVLGRIAGAADELSRVADVHGYFRRLDEAQRPGGGAGDRHQRGGAGDAPRRHLRCREPGRPAAAREITARLADPRRTSREEARRLAEEGKVIYYLLGGLHSTETGSPEMLMELAYRLAVSERPEIRAIREHAVVLITPVVEPDGRDRQVDWFYRHLRGRDVPWEELARDPLAAVLGPLRRSTTTTATACSSRWR